MISSIIGSSNIQPDITSSPNEFRLVTMGVVAPTLATNRHHLPSPYDARGQALLMVSLFYHRVRCPNLATDVIVPLHIRCPRTQFSTKEFIFMPGMKRFQIRFQVSTSRKHSIYVSGEYHPFLLLNTSNTVLNTYSYLCANLYMSNFRTARS